MCIIQQAYKYVSLRLWPHLMFVELKITNILNQVGGDWEGVSCHGNRTLIAIGVLPVELFAYQVSMVCAANWPR